MATISRAFLEIGAQYDGLKKGLEDAVRIAEQNGAKLSSAGKKMVENFQNSLNPTKQLATQLEALEKSGASAAQIESVLGDKIRYATAEAKKHGQPIDDIVKKYSRWEDSAKVVGERMTRLGMSMSMYVTAPLVAAGAGALKLAGDFEQTTIAFTTMLGSAEKAGAFLKELEAFALQTPFEFTDLLEASKRMMALGFAAEQVIPTMTAIGDAVAALGGGGEMINRVTLALGQMQAKGKVSAEEMRQLAEAGIPAWDMLAKKIGVSIPEAMKLAEKGAISASQALPAILEGMSEKFGGLMARQSQTFLGQIANMKDSLYFTLRDLGQALLPIASSAMENFIKPMVEGLQSLAEWFSDLPKPLQTTIIAIGGLAAAAGPVLMAVGGITTGLASLAPMLPAIAGGVTSVVAAMGPWTIALAGISAALLYFSDDIADATRATLEFLGVVDKLPDVNTRNAEAAERVAEELKISVEAMDSLTKVNKHALLILGQHKTEINLLQQAMANGNITQAEYEIALRKIIDAQEKGVGVADKIITARQKEADATEKLRTATEKLLKPADELGKRIEKQLQFMSNEQAVKLYGDEIRKATVRQIELTGEVDESTMALFELAMEMDRMERAARISGDSVNILDYRLERMAGAMELVKHKVDEGPLETLRISGVGLNDILLDTSTELGKVSGEFDRASERSNEFGNVVSTTLTNMTQQIADKVTKWAGPFQDFASAALSALMEGLFKPILDELTSMGNAIGNWLTGVFTGNKSGGLAGSAAGLGGLLGKGVGAIGGLLGIGGGSTAAAAGTGSLAGMSGVSTSSAAMGGSSAMSSLGAFMTNPWTIGIAGAGALGYLGYKWATGPDSYEAGVEEIARDFGGVKMSKDHYKAIVNSMGITEEEAWNYRAQINRSPVMLAQIYLLAEQQGKVNQFLAAIGPYGKGTYGNDPKNPNSAGVDLETAFRAGLQGGDWNQLNNIYSALMGNSAFGSLSKILPDWQKRALLDTPSYASGIDYVPNDGLAYLHKGEAVIPANQNRGITINLTVNSSGEASGIKEAVYSAFMDLSARGVFA